MTRGTAPGRRKRAVSRFAQLPLSVSSHGGIHLTCAHTHTHVVVSSLNLTAVLKQRCLRAHFVLKDRLPSVTFHVSFHL